MPGAFSFADDRIHSSAIAKWPPFSNRNFGYHRCGSDLLLGYEGFIHHFFAFPFFLPGHGTLRQ